VRRTPEDRRRKRVLAAGLRKTKPREVLVEGEMKKREGWKEMVSKG
jgi:hypothetical protein